MKKGQKRNIILVCLSVAVILAGGLYYITSVQRALWNKSVTDILEVTVQGRHALDTYLEKDKEMVHWLAADLAAESSFHENKLHEKLILAGAGNSSCFCVNLDTGTVYTPQLEGEWPLDPDQLEIFRGLQGSGIRKPFLDGRTGVWTLAYYERFLWPDGSQGFVQKTQPLSEIADRFSLSFYNNAGFSYVVDREGDILIRSQHRNSNRTFQNLFDIIDLQGNDSREIDSFQASLENSRRGAARFRYQKEDYVFCYVPMEQVPDWYVVSIIPNRVIMEQANSIVQDSLLFLFLIFACASVMGAFFMIYRNSARRILLAEENARKAAESANAAKSRFLSNMSHDIRTPMNAILGMTRLAMDHIHESDKVSDYLKKIGLSGQLLVGLINDILDMSKIESGKMVLNQETASLEPLFTSLVGIIQPSAAAKNLTFDIRLHGIEHESLCFDSLRLNQILLNLLSNAVKFTPEGGSVSVDVTELPSRRQGLAHLRFRVSDTGIGMSPEFLEHIFDSFTREHDDRVNKIEGTGLGMAITKMIVDRMDGTIVVESRPGQGSVFTVDLDLPIPSGIALPDMSLPRIRILVADDDSDTCRSASEFLKELGMTADITSSGQEAVEKAVAAHLEGRDYDLALLDWKMPDLSGVQAAQAIRLKAGYDLPVIIVSAYDWISIEKEAMEAGVNGFIQKPFFKSTLYHCIRQHVLHEDGYPQWQDDRVNLTGRRILMAEDNELNREISLELLISAGAQVETAVNGQECVEFFAQSVPGYFDLILMDIQMPIMNGYDAARQIRTMDRPDALAIPIFAITADAFAEDMEEAKKAGMNSHLAKPLDIPAMMQEIKKYLEP
ncbi:response regulator [Enterocloster citroniae]